MAVLYGLYGMFLYKLNSYIVLGGYRVNYFNTITVLFLMEIFPVLSVSQLWDS